MIIHLMTLLISGIGILKALTKYSVPELSKSYWDENPFAIKSQKIDAVNKWIFTSFAFIGLLFQAFTLIWGKNIPDRNYGVGTYVIIFAVGLLVILIIVFLLNKAGKMIARMRWLPEIVEKHRDIYAQARFIVEHDGLKEKEIERKDALKNPEKCIQTNFDTVDKHLTHIERLLDIPHDKTDYRQRLDRLKCYFD